MTAISISLMLLTTTNTIRKGRIRLEMRQMTSCNAQGYTDREATMKLSPRPRWATVRCKGCDSRKGRALETRMSSKNFGFGVTISTEGHTGNSVA
jgi:hypothetical protein